MTRNLSKVSRLIGVSLACLGGFGIAWAGDVPVRTSAPSVYTVVKGDTLWDISGLYLESPWRWPKLWEANPKIANPHLIYPGDRILLSWRDGKPFLLLERAGSDLSALTTVDPSRWKQLLNQDLLMDRAELAAVPRVIEPLDGRHFYSGDQPVRVKGMLSDQSWGIYRPGQTFERDSDEQQVVVLKLVARASVSELNKSGTLLELKAARQEVRPGDLLLPLDKAPQDYRASFTPQPATAKNVARLLANLSETRYSQSGDVVVIDQGAEDGIGQGQVFAVRDKTSNGQAHYPLLGEVMVLRAYGHFSLAQVTRAQAPISTGSVLSAPESAEK